jgi:hypothetical protein
MTQDSVTSNQLIANVDTFITQFPVDNSTRLPGTDKVFLESGKHLAIASYQENASPNHYKIELVIPINTFIFWYAYKPHVTIK